MNYYGYWDYPYYGQGQGQAQGHAQVPPQAAPMTQIPAQVPQVPQVAQAQQVQQVGQIPQVGQMPQVAQVSQLGGQPRQQQPGEDSTSGILQRLNPQNQYLGYGQQQPIPQLQQQPQPQPQQQQQQQPQQPQQQAQQSPQQQQQPQVQQQQQQPQQYDKGLPQLQPMSTNTQQMMYYPYSGYSHYYPYSGYSYYQQQAPQQMPQIVSQEEDSELKSQQPQQQQLQQQQTQQQPLAPPIISSAVNSHPAGYTQSPSSRYYQLPPTSTYQYPRFQQYGLPMIQQQSQASISTPKSTNRNSSGSSTNISQFGTNSPLDSFSNASPNPKDFPLKRRKSNKKSHLTPTQPNTTTFSQQGQRSKVTTTMWEDENTLCYQVEANGVSVVRRADNDMINGTKLLNVTRMTRGRRDGILKAEKIRHVVKIGSMHLKGVWIPFERALVMAQREKIVDLLYPLFVRDIQSIIQQESNGKYQQQTQQHQHQPLMPLPQQNPVPYSNHQDDSSNHLMVLTQAGVAMQQQGNYNPNPQIPHSNINESSDNNSHQQQQQQQQQQQFVAQSQVQQQPQQLETDQSLRPASVDNNQEKLHHPAGQLTEADQNRNDSTTSQLGASSKQHDEGNSNTNANPSNLKD